MKVDCRYYTAPHQLVDKKLDIRYTERPVKYAHKGERVASPTVASWSKAVHHHQEHAKWTPKKSPTGCTRSARPRPSWPR
ncbi:hypothetical protein DFAR_3000003 [Desulfarculales bacterium]